MEFCHSYWAQPGWELHCSHSHCHPEMMACICRRTRTQLEPPSWSQNATSRGWPPCGAVHPSPRAPERVRVHPVLWEVVREDHRPSRIPLTDVSVQLFPSCRSHPAQYPVLDAGTTRHQHYCMASTARTQPFPLSYHERQPQVPREMFEAWLQARKQTSVSASSSCLN